MTKTRFPLSLIRKKTCVRPTWLGWLIIITVVLIVFRWVFLNSYQWLAVNEPVEANTLVVEGWVETYVVLDALEYYKEKGFKRMIVTGMPITIYEFIAPYSNTADATAYSMQYYGFTDTIYRAVIPSNTFVDRTYNTALTVGELFRDHPEWEKKIDVYSVGVHSKRSLYLFRKALGPEFEVGIVAHPDRTFQADHWWKSSKGFRNVTNEMLATPYALFFFKADREKALHTLTVGRYEDSIRMLRQLTDKSIRDTAQSPFTAAERAEFHGLHYYDPLYQYRIKAEFTLDTSKPVFELATNTIRKPLYRPYGTLNFYIHDTLCQLTAYQYMGQGREIPPKSLFVPFKDRTSGVSTYGAGRYIDMTVPETDTTYIDFNLCYNPYCAYSERWSCPLVPFENVLDVAIRAGEKKYHDDH